MAALARRSLFALLAGLPFVGAVKAAPVQVLRMEIDAEPIKRAIAMIGGEFSPGASLRVGGIAKGDPFEGLQVGDTIKWNAPLTDEHELAAIDPDPPSAIDDRAMAWEG